MGLERTWKNKNARDYRYKLTDTENINIVKKPEGYKAYKNGKGFYRQIKRQNLTEAQIQGQAFGQIRRYDKKIERARYNLGRVKKARLRKKYENELRRLEEKQSQALEKIVETETYKEGGRDVKLIIKTSATVYVTGKYTDGTKMSFRVPVEVSYTEGDEGEIPLKIESAVYSAVYKEDSSFSDFETIEIDKIEGA